MVALILADGDAPTRARLDAAWPGWDDDIDLVVAADGGLRHAAALGVRVDLWVGDADSVVETELADLAAAGVTLERWPTDKDASDTDLAIDAALLRGATAVVVVGALGGPRVDHALANIASLARPDHLGRVTIVDDRSRLTVVGPDADDQPGVVPLVGRSGDLVTLLPADGDVAGVSTDGLRYSLADERLELGSSRGLSNVIDRAGARVSVRRGRLLVIESPATL
jgi:thiamine pyrophosphokinase